MTPGSDSGSVMPMKVATGFAPRSAEASSKPPVELFEADIDWHDHQRQIAVDDAEQHGAGSIEQTDIIDADHLEQMR